MIGDGVPLDVDLGEAMDVVYEMILASPENKDTPDQLRARIAAHNLKAFATVLLMADDNADTIKVNLKQIVLGLLGTSDWLTKNLPPLGEEGEDY